MLMATERPTPTTAAQHTKKFRCRHCARVLGQIVGQSLHEENGAKSAFPVVRRCPDCGRRNVKVAA